MDRLADFDRLSVVCAWLNSLPLYMFSGELTAALMLFAYDRNDINLVDPAVRAVLTYQASLEGQMHYEKFIDMVANVVDHNPPKELVDFLSCEVTH